MTSIESVRDAINKHFQQVRDVGDGIVRGERQLNGKPFAVAYIDLSDEVVERSRNLKGFQEKLIGSDFFSSSNDLRWNSYLFFWAGPRSKASEYFRDAKSQIESDRHFARKFVLDENDLTSRLGEKAETHEANDIEIDAGGTWADLLRADSLAVLLEQRPRTAAVELIESGEAFKAEIVRPVAVATVVKDALATGLLRELTIGQFRRVYKEQSFEFGDVNLIIGPNGTGKTSLLEAIEVLYCGRVRRDLEATFVNVEGKVEDLEGTTVTVKATTVTATLKARNMAWYGRTDIQANAISQGFSRFNFLDTDAAFRLSSEQNKDQIQLDLARLIVGPETSRLWMYLSKLKEEVATRLKSATDQIPAGRLNVELLDEELTRLKNAPSQSSSLLKSFRSSVLELHPRWELPGADSIPSSKERSTIVDVMKSVERALASAQETPVSRSSVARQLSRFQQAWDSAKSIQVSYEKSLQEANSASVQIRANLSSRLEVDRWAKLLNAGVPGLAERLDSTEVKVSNLRQILQRHHPEALHTALKEYDSISLSDGLALASSKYDEAKENEQTAALAQSQAQQLGQTLEALRRDLHDASKAYIERSGERNLCPVCRTVHDESDLHAKLQGLVASDNSQVSDGLRHGLQLARERVEECRLALHTLTSLDAYRVSIHGAPESTPKDLQADLKFRQEQLGDIAAELEAARNEVKSLELLGLEFATWKLVRDSASKWIAPQAEIYDIGEVNVVLSRLEEQLKADTARQAEQNQAMRELSNQAKQLAADAGIPPAGEFSPTQVSVALERMLARAKVAMAALDEVDAAIPLSDDSSIEALQTVLQACILAFDKAALAIADEASAESLTKTKQDEFQTATKRLSKNLAASENLARAMATLSTIVEKHSLDKATADSFSTIRSRVSDVFAQIHSPPEYALGNFSDGQLIIRRDDSSPHEVSQVSTGQRAALALSIFLALNESARTAPPVILIDDPVAHIDDLNALSFLDYLRDVVVAQRKQVFFATADARLAALFQRKFEFLGEQRFKRINLGRLNTATVL